MRMKISSLLSVALGAVWALTALEARAQEAPPAHHVRGTLTAVSASAITVNTPSGPVSVPINDQTKVVGVVPTTLEEVTSGSYIGTANVPGATSTSVRALEVVVFPQSMAGVGEGDYPWDLPAGKGHSSMTNGTVAAGRAGSMMTNGTVTGVNNRGVKIITVQYKGGSKSVTISPSVPIVRAVPGTRSLLATGAHVVAFPAAGGAAAPFIVVGERGAIPPM